MQCVNEYSEKLACLKGIMKNHSIDTTRIDAMIDEIKCFKVATPIIGNFSTGKSSLINAILQKEILAVDITPKTSIPTEVYYGDGKVILWKKDGSKENVDTSKLPLNDSDIVNVSKVSVEYNNDFLHEINNVKIVDMPGFDTKIQNHNTALNAYIPNSMAYILLVSVDEPVLKDDIADFIRDLDLYEIPLYVVLTKCSRISEEELKQCKELILNIINKIVIDVDVQVTFAESYGDINVEGVKEYLRNIQKDADELFKRRFKSKVSNFISDIKTYISTQLLKKGMTYSQLEIEKEKINSQMNALLDKVELEMNNFDRQTKECIDDIEYKIKDVFNEDIQKYCVMIQNNEKLDKEVNLCVKKVVTNSIKNEYEPRLRNYLKRMSDMIKICAIGDDSLRIEMLEVTTEKQNISLAKKIVPLACGLVGGLIKRSVGLVVGLVIGILVDVAYNIYQSYQKNTNSEILAKKMVDMVVQQVMSAIKKQIISFTRMMNEDLKTEVIRQNDLYNKALEDIEMRITIENTLKNKQIEELEKELVTIKKLLLDI